MAKTILKQFSAGTTGYEPILADSITIVDYAFPKSLIFSSTDERDYVQIIRQDPDTLAFTGGEVTDGEGDFQLNSDNKDVTLVTPDTYGLLPRQPTYGVITIWKVEV